MEIATKTLSKKEAIFKVTYVKKAVFPVGGIGTRFLPATKALPKEMLPIIDKPLIQYAVEEALASGIEEFIFVTGRGKTAIEDHFDKAFELEEILKKRQQNDLLESLANLNLEPGQISYVRQQEPLGLGHAVWCARNLIGAEPFAILLADDFILDQQPCLKQMQEAYKVLRGNIAAVIEIPLEESYKYGMVDIKEENGAFIHAKGLIEKPDPTLAPSHFAVIGRYILHPSIFDFLGQHYHGKGGEIQLTDAISASISEQPLTGFRFQGRRYDCGSKKGMLAAIFACALEREDTRTDAWELMHEHYKNLKN